MRAGYTEALRKRLVRPDLGAEIIQLENAARKAIFRTVVR